MKKPENKRVVVVGFEIATALGYGLKKTWKRAINSESGFDYISRIDVGDYPVKVVGEIPDLDFTQYDFFRPRDHHNWFSKFIPLAMILSHDALKHSRVKITEENSYRAGIILGSALAGFDGYEQTLKKLNGGTYNSVSPFLLPNLCSNLSCGKTSILLNLKGPQYSVGGACATGNHCIADGARMIQRGEADVILSGGVEMPILKPIIYGFGNMNTLVEAKEKDRAYHHPELSSRPYSIDRNGFVLSEGGGVLGAEGQINRDQHTTRYAHQLQPRKPFGLAGRTAQLRVIDEKGGQDSEKNHIQDQRKTDEIAHLGRVRLKNIFDHPVVDDDAELIHEIDDQRTQKKEDDEEGLCERFVTNDRQREDEKGRYMHEQRKEE